MVAGRQVFRHPSCRERHYILEKLSIFYREHNTPIEQVLRDLREAVAGSPGPSTPRKPSGSRAGRAAGPAAARRRPAPRGGPPRRRPRAPPNTGRRRTGPRPLSAILPELLLRLGVTMVESSASGETDPT